jgi:hypothetical protein
MRSVQIYIEGERDSNDYTEIELFNDEKIEINLSIQNIQDISKVFTDFSQSFTVPASTINNSIFKHFYENAVDLDSTLIDQRLRRNAFIEIDRTPFRNGKIQLEKANLKDGQPESYTITFYGNLVTLKDLFGEDKLSDLDFEDLNHELTGAQIYNRITDGATDYDVRYPLISSSDVWTYNDGSSTDISTSTGRISYLDLFPALKVAKIFESIENKYSIDFTGLFLSDERFTKLFLWCKNREESQIQTDTQLIDIYGGGSIFNYTTGTVTVSGSPVFVSGVANVLLSVSFVTNSNNYYIQVYVNDSLHQTIQGSGVNSYLVYTNSSYGTFFTNKIKCYVYADDDITINTHYTYYHNLRLFNDTTEMANVTSLNMANQLSANTNLKTYMPDMKVSDFFSGILKQFNLTCYPTALDTFELEPLDYWYQKGAVTDITDFVDIATIDVAKVPLYSTISFEHEESKSFTNVQYKDTFNKAYGDLKSNYDFEGGDLSVKVPFENLLFDRFTGQDIQVGYALTAFPDFKPYVPKPCLLYMYDETAISNIKFFNGSTEQTITDYMPFGQDLLTNGINYSLNFGQEISSFITPTTSVPNSIYSVYYQGYLNNLFNPKNRLTSLKAIFPTSLITSLELNDRVIIRDKRYIINNIKTDLTTGEVDLELVNDFREISSGSQIILNESSGLIEIPILVPNGVNDVNVTTASTGVTLGATTNFTSDGILEVNYSANPDPLFNRVTENGDTRITDDLITRRSESGTNFVIQLDLENTYINGDVKNTQIYLIQEA